MKKVLLSTVLLVVGAISVSAQGVHIGVKAGAGLSKIDGSSFQNGFKLGYQLGAFAIIDVSPVIGIEPEVLFNQSNTKTVASPPTPENVLLGDYNATLNYLSIPILLRIKASEIFAFNVGPQYSILTIQDHNLTTNATNAFKTGDFALVLGVQLKLNNNFHVFGRYNIGLLNINQLASQDKWTNQQVQLGLGLKLF
jgi:opacity protein-like surface antigen